jgi:hypothetical protein
MELCMASHGLYKVAYSRYDILSKKFQVDKEASENHGFCYKITL